MSSAQLKSKTNFSQTGQGILEVIVTIGIGTIMILALVILSVRTNRSSDFSKANSQAEALATEGLETIKNLRSTNIIGALNHYCETTPFDPNQDLSSSSSCTGAWVQGTNPKSWSDFFAKVDLQDEKPNVTDWRYDNVFGHWSGYGYQAHLHTYTTSTFSVINDPSSAYTCSGGPPCDIQELVGDPAGLPVAYNTGCATIASGCIDLHHDFGGVLVGGRIFRRILFIADTPTNYPSGCDPDLTSNFGAQKCGMSHCNSTTWAGPTPTDWNAIKQFTVEVSWEDTSGHHAVTKSECISA